MRKLIVWVKEFVMALRKTVKQGERRLNVKTWIVLIVLMYIAAFMTGCSGGIGIGMNGSLYHPKENNGNVWKSRAATPIHQASVSRGWPKLREDSE